MSFGLVSFQSTISLALMFDLQFLGLITFHHEIHNELNLCVNITILYHDTEPSIGEKIEPFSTYIEKEVPLDSVIKKILAKTKSSRCVSFVPPIGSEPKIKFHVVQKDHGGCIVLPASEQYHHIQSVHFVENDELHEQKDFFHPVTEEAILKTPAHGNNIETTMIFQARQKRKTDFGLMVTAAGDECHVNELPFETGKKIPIDNYRVAIKERTKVSKSLLL